MQRSAKYVLIASLFSLCLLYINVAVITNGRADPRSVPRLPLPKPLYNAFLIFGVFNYYETNNEELTIWGLATNRDMNLTFWKLLPAEQYFPFARGERSSRMWANMHYHNLDRQGHWETWQAVGKKILDRHNRLYPQDPITKVAFQSMTWPRSPAGFYARHSIEEYSKRYWIIAEKK